MEGGGTTKISLAILYSNRDYKSDWLMWNSPKRDLSWVGDASYFISHESHPKNKNIQLIFLKTYLFSFGYLNNIMRQNKKREIHLFNSHCVSECVIDINTVINPINKKSHSKMSL